MPRKLPVESRCRRRSRGGGAAYTVAHHTRRRRGGTLPSPRIKACVRLQLETCRMNRNPVHLRFFRVETVKGCLKGRNP